MLVAHLIPRCRCGQDSSQDHCRHQALLHARLTRRHLATLKADAARSRRRMPQDALLGTLEASKPSTHASCLTQGCSHTPPPGAALALLAHPAERSCRCRRLGVAGASYSSVSRSRSESSSFTALALNALPPPLPLTSSSSEAPSPPPPPQPPPLLRVRVRE